MTSLLTVATEDFVWKGAGPCRTDVELMNFPLKDYRDEDACSCKTLDLYEFRKMDAR